MTAVHHPDTLRFSVALFDLREERLQDRFITRVAGHHFIGQRKTLRRDDQRDDHLDTIRTVIATVAKLSFVARGKRRIALKIGGRQIIIPSSE